MSTRLVAAAFSVAVLGSSVSAAGQVQADEENAGRRPQSVVFDHREGGRRAYTLYLRDAEPFTIEIRNTCDTEFEYDVLSITEDQPPPSQRSFRAYGVLGDKVIDVVHDASYGGYFVEIRRPDTSVACRDPEDPKTLAALSPTRLTIITPARAWRTRISGAYTMTFLPKEDCPGGETCDSVKQGLATFVHTYHDKFPHVASVFGLGIGGASQVDYFIGAGFRLGNEGALNIGRVAGKRRAGSDAPVRWSWFMGVSYAFIDTGGSALQQPFAGGDRQGSAGAGGR